MLRALVLAGLLAVAPAAFLSGSSASAQAQNPPPAKCQDTPEKKAKRSMFGGLASAIGGGLLGHAGAAGSVVAASLPAVSYLGDELLKMLDCKEQQQAAKATDQAIRGGVGTEVSWTSETRPNVSGTSKVTGKEQLADGGDCLTVTDVVIVDGEETTVPKKMCRAKGASGYAKV
jgi:predicted lipid-binding transport protein (Tim44 family)